MTTVIAAESTGDDPIPVGIAVRRACAALLSSSTARLDAEILMAHVLGRSRAWIIAHPEYVPAEVQRSAFDSLCARRAMGEPVSYLTGVQGFWSFELLVTPAVLIPRPETELLVETCLALNVPESQNLRVADLGTGSGAVAIALAIERPHWQVTATDCSEPALAVARINAAKLCPGRIRFQQGSWLAALPAHEKFDLIVSNPPYIDPQDPHLQDGSLRYEPQLALASVDHGLADLGLIIKQSAQRLQPSGWLALEHGYDQGASVRALMQSAGYLQVHTQQDLAGLDRITLGRRSGHE
jgi:release factor glutamine methyltransferase